MSAEPWFRFFPSDFLSGVSGLSASERGVYISLLSIMYDRGGPLKREDDRLARQCGLPKAGFVRALQALTDQGKIEIDGQWLCNSRAKSELTERAGRIASARRGAEVTNAKTPNNSDDDLRYSDRSSDHNDGAMLPAQGALRARAQQPQSQLQEKDRDANASLVSGEPLPADLKIERDRQRLVEERARLHLLGCDWNSLAGSCGLSQIDEITAGSPREKAALARIREGRDFAAVFAKIRASPFLRGETTTFRASFNWIINPTNLVKILEGAYDEIRKGQPAAQRAYAAQ